MNYKTLTQEETNIWLSNLSKAIALETILLNAWTKRCQQTTDEYEKKYRYNKWLRWWWNEEHYFYYRYDGKVALFSSLFFALSLTPLTENEQMLRYWDCSLVELTDVYSRWSVYARQPFELSESDVIYYQKLNKMNNENIELAKLLGLEYETFYMDENS